MQPTSKTAWQMIAAYFRDFRVLRETRGEYWGIQIVNFLDCTFYFAMLTIATVFLSEDLGLNDKHAGYSVAIFTSATTLMLLLSGLYTDRLGIKKSLYVSMAAMWLVLGVWAFIGCLAAVLIPGSLTQGVRWKVEPSRYNRIAVAQTQAPL